MKHRDLAIVLVLVAACGSRKDAAVGERASPGGATAARPRPLRPPDPIAKGLPHSATIERIAATEQGDAALSADANDGLRLWPTLDGTRPPVAIPSPSPAEQLALFHDGQDLIACVLDTAGGVTLLRLALDGTILSRAQLMGESAFVEIVAVDNQLLARTADHALELYGADGDPRGRVMAGPGERITDLASRRGRAAAVIATAEGGAMLRWIAAGAHLAWETPLSLPVLPRDNMFAIAPGKRRIAFVASESFELQVFDLGTVPVLVPGPLVPVTQSHTSLGFVDDDTLGIGGAPTLWWSARPPVPKVDPWAVPPSSSALFTMAAAIADGRMIGGAATSLALVDPSRTHYLGYKDVAQNGTLNVGENIVTTPNGTKFTWFDDHLRTTRTIDITPLRESGEPWLYGTAVGSHHVLTQGVRDGETVLDLIDASAPLKRIPIGRFDGIDRQEVAGNMLAVTKGRTVRRFRIDFATSTAEELRPALTLPLATTNWTRVFDPAKADGLIALAAGWDSESSEHGSLYAYRQVGTKIERTKVKPFDATLINADPSGRVLAWDGTVPALLVVHGTTVERRVPATRGLMAMAMDPAAQRIAMREDSDIVIRDRAGVEQWRTTLWGASQLGFTADGARLVVAGPGGYVAFDAASGERVARECAWNFGLYDTIPDASSMSSASVCEDPVVQ